ncbi:bifunctional phosphoribosyl-AMP cyclohydrolase/phosphoribosyl-ATP pyrophosphatase [Helicobacter anseris]|uniref:Histidine biosynthesis bifunctional protein HisIE n=1 Tax=Helicobacter anseris TaxID=375926 RepID=A0A3D8JAM4_9HELI|nr:bifunctional phosphoribosyl-AMP cyclohydrolase/phosphoribosyl-ATP diphosphatase HisIE [Helicobacter anseris]RDU74488.1 bifunctional phosphoribosyl-AMP cyclohydrolase/phosphoribosyl-ATP pyrophosphatase [Helicobacter anseris]
MMDVNAIIQNLDWKKSPLIPSIIQDYKTLDVLMLGFVNQEALRLSIESGVMHYFSRTKNRIWKKGESSGNFQKIKEIKIDCDNDSLLFFVEQVGVACHTGSKSCFFKDVAFENKEVTPQEKKQNDDVLDSLYHILLERRLASSDTSYTALLFEKGINTICKKIAEEAGELLCEFKDANKDKIIYEASDLLYHLMVGLVYFNIHPDAILQELKRRFSFSGIEEKNNRQK